MNAVYVVALAIQALSVPSAQAGSSTDSVVIPAKNIGELDRCRPLRIGEASECMRRALGESAATEINTPAGERYRAAFAQLITKKWDLKNPEAAISRDLRGLRIYDPSDAAYVLLTDMAARIGRYRLDYDKFARERASKPPQPPVTVAVQKTVERKPGPLPLDECKRPEDGTDLKVLSCTLGSDRRISRTTSSGTAGAPPPGAVAISLEQCQNIGPILAGSRLKACYRLPDGRVLRQTVRPAEVPNN